jgi:hypothetical protein
MSALIEDAACDDRVDATKLHQLISAKERLMQNEARAAFVRGLARLQTKLPIITERGEIKARGGQTYTYALWEDINEIIKPILSRHGFALSFRTGRQGDQIEVTGMLSHRGGHVETTSLLLPMDASGSKNPVQAVGSSTSYGKRYTAQALLNLTSRGEDDDGVGAGSSSRAISGDQLKDLEELIQEVGADRERLLRYLGVEALSAIPADRMSQAVAALNAKRRAA